MIVAAFLVRQIYLVWFCPYQLLGDEAYYWEQARHLDWCYNEKGPVLAWLIAGCCKLFGDSAWAIRLPVSIASAVAAWGVGRLAIHVARGDERAGFVAVACFLLIPAFQANAIISTQDGILIALWVWLTAIGLRLLRRWYLNESTRWDWIWLWVALGIGVILKQSVLVFLLSLVAYAWIERRRLCWTKDLLWQPLIGAVIVTLICTPMIVWNAQHGWPMLAHTLGHLGAGGDQAGRVNRGNPLQWVPAVVGSIIGATGPAIVIMIWATWRFWGGRGSARLSSPKSVRAGDVSTKAAEGEGEAPSEPLWSISALDQSGSDRASPAQGAFAHNAFGSDGASPAQTSGARGSDRASPAHQNTDIDRYRSRLWMMCAAWPSVIFFVLLALRKPVVPSWPLPSMVPLCVLVSELTLAELSRVKMLWQATVVYGLGACFLIAYPTVLARLPGVGPHIERSLISRFTGHREDAAELEKTLATISTPDGRPPVIVARHYMQAGLYCFYLPGHPTVCTAGKYLGKRSTTFDQWPDTNLENPKYLGRTLLLDGEGDVTWEQALLFDRRVPIDGGKYFLAFNYRGPNPHHPRMIADD